MLCMNLAMEVQINYWTGSKYGGRHRPTCTGVDLNMEVDIHALD